MLNPPSEKIASFSCHVEYVEYVECFGNYEGPFDFGEGWPKNGDFEQFFWNFGVSRPKSASFSCHVEYVESC